MVEKGEVALPLTSLFGGSTASGNALQRRSFLQALPLAACPIGLTAFAGAEAKQNIAGERSFWSGWAYMVRVADVGPAKIKVICISEFQLEADAAESFTGRATASYDVEIDDSKLRGVLAIANSSLSAGVGQTSPYAALLGTGVSLTDLLGVGIAFPNGAEIRQNAISGKLENGKLAIGWAEAPPRLEYQISRVYVTKEVIARNDTAPAYAPWVMAGTVSCVGKDPAYAVGAGQRKKGQVRESGIWSAVRIR